ncbi:outer membrane beta-barrel protein [Helicobacter sp. NHP22-001]|uniref:outer membrane beta-barrel protein n=1 Tax=Helicobacter sp. NHP22-001 TaxID=3040202 RepID=UPI00244D8BCC|nr:outer membrane beta-barrel protein [Helicobacter sp. NHP22-001]GMB96229.1 hypothetical protein NHP22001_08180 [Helicobacter sp. NHP22-001]
MRTFLAMGLVWTWAQAHFLPTPVLAFDMLEESPNIDMPKYNLQPYLFPEGELQETKQATQPEQPSKAKQIPKPPVSAEKTMSSKQPQETQENILHVVPLPTLGNAKTEDPNRLHELDEKIKVLKNKIKGMGGTPQTEFRYTKKGTRAKKVANHKIAKEKSGFFLGGGYGFGTINESYNSQQAKSVALGIPEQQEIFSVLPKLSGAANMANVELGYQQYFNPYFGARIYGDLLFIPGFANYTTLNDNTTSRGFGGFFYGLGSLNMDLLFDAPLEKQKKHFIGAYAGFGVGLMVLKDRCYNAFRQVLQEGYNSPNTLWKTLIQVDYTINLGVAFTYNRHLRFEVGTKIPLTYLRLGFETPATYTNKNNSQQLISEDTGFKRSSLLVMNVLYAF